MRFCKSNKINQLIFHLHPVFANFCLLAKVLFMIRDFHIDLVRLFQASYPLLKRT